MRARYIAAELHALLAISVVLLYLLFQVPALNSPSALLFIILLIADFPMSVVAFYIMFTSDERGFIVAGLWAVLGTVWWFFIGSAIDTRLRRSREKNASATPENPSVNSEESDVPRREFVIALSVVAILTVASLAWGWKPDPGHFDKGQLKDFAFAPDGQSLLLVRSPDVTSRLESESLASTASPAVRSAMPCGPSSLVYSPDGQQIAFACASQPDGRSRIMVADPSGANLHPLFSSASDNSDFAPHFSSDGKTIYFARISPFIKDNGRVGNFSQRWDLCSASLDGKNQRQLTNRHFDDFRVAMSLDSKKMIVYGDTTSGTRALLFSLDTPGEPGAAIHPVIPNESHAAMLFDITFAPDAQNIYFLAPSKGKTAFDYDVYSMNLATDAVEKLTNANGYATNLSVAGDGQTAVFLRWTSRWGSYPSLSRLYSLDLSTRRLTPLNVTGTN